MAEYGKTPQDGDLRRGAHEDDPYTIRKAVAAGADPNGMCLSGGLTVLHVAAMEGRSEAVRTLLELGAKSDAKDVYGNTPVHHAAMRNKLAAMRALAESGADLSAPNGDRYTPLHLAVDYGQPSMAEMLLGLGADPNVKDRHGRTPLQFATEVVGQHPDAMSRAIGEILGAKRMPRRQDNTREM